MALCRQGGGQPRGLLQRGLIRVGSGKVVGSSRRIDRSSPEQGSQVVKAGEGAQLVELFQEGGHQGQVQDQQRADLRGEVAENGFGDAGLGVVFVVGGYKGHQAMFYKDIAHLAARRVAPAQGK
ncbi:hypothetical protein HBH53_049130 [Parastagonospora nodorum]|nr:hypothetical protein HBH53_049130 [Parastagonospora nodorum]